MSPRFKFPAQTDSAFSSPVLPKSERAKNKNKKRRKALATGFLSLLLQQISNREPGTPSKYLAYLCHGDTVNKLHVLGKDVIGGEIKNNQPSTN